MEYAIKDKVRGVRIIAGEQARDRRVVLNQLIEIAESKDFKKLFYRVSSRLKCMQKKRALKF